MKSTKNIIFVIVIALVIIAQFYYGFTTYRDDCEAIAVNKEQIAEAQRKIDDLEAKLLKHEESKQQLKRLEIEKTALLEMIPNQTAYTQFLSHFYDYLCLIDFDEMLIKQNPATVINNGMGQIYKREYEIQYISTYTESKKMMEHINSMYQASNISKYTFDSSVQQGEGEKIEAYKARYGNGFYELGRTSFTFSVFYRAEDGILDEIYQPNISAQVNSTEPFRNDKLVSGTAEGTDDMTLPGQTPVATPSNLPVVNGSSFDLNIGDILISGDIYKLSGPGEGVGRYVGLSSSSNVSATIVVYDDHYELSLEDDKGQVEQCSVYTTITNPTLRIISNMRQLEAVMPNVHVYVYNYTDKIMPVKLVGSLTENIHIFNEHDQHVTQGETKGNISLT